MTTLQTLKVRIRTVQATQKITTAMKLVSAAKLRKAQERLHAFQVYSSAVGNMWKSATSDLSALDMPKWMQSKGDDHLYIVLMSDRGLCGSYNAAMVRHMRKVMDERKLSHHKTKILPIGNKALDLLKRDMGEFFAPPIIQDQKDKPKGDLAVESLFDYLLDYLNNNDYGVVRIFYTHFVSILTQEIDTIDLVMEQKEKGRENGAAISSLTEHVPLFEPDQETLVSKLAPLFFKNQIRYTLFESATSEQAARMRAMDTATENARDVITKLRRTYNRNRQANITRELIEIISGANALEERTDNRNLQASISLMIKD